MSKLSIFPLNSVSFCFVYFEPCCWVHTYLYLLYLPGIFTFHHYETFLSLVKFPVLKSFIFIQLLQLSFDCCFCDVSFLSSYFQSTVSLILKVVSQSSVFCLECCDFLVLSKNVYLLPIYNVITVMFGLTPSFCSVLHISHIYMFFEEVGFLVFFLPFLS